MRTISYKSFLRNYYLASSLYDFIFAYAIYTVLFSIRGLSVFQISLLLTWWALVATVFEIPTGALADSWSRKKMLTLAPFIKALCFLIWFLADGNFYLFALGFTLWALGSAFVSGTTESLLYDTLAHFEKTDEYERVLGRKKFYFNIALAIACICGGFIASYKLDWAVLFSIVPLLLSALFASLMVEVPKVKSTEETHYFECIKIAFQEVKTNRVLLYLFVYLFGISIFGVLEEFDQLYYRLANLPIFAFGMVGFLWSAFNAIGAYYAHRLKGQLRLFYLLPFTGAVCLALVARYPSIPMLGLLLLAYFITSPLHVLVESSIQHNIKSSSRATVTSASALLLNLPILTPILGLIGKVWNLQAIYLATAIFLFGFAFWVFLVRNKVAVRTANA